MLSVPYCVVTSQSPLNYTKIVKLSCKNTEDSDISNSIIVNYFKILDADS